jgi:ABC-type transport system involved in cytochrome bd biosynthesis fused ATPase/permease subunit
MQRIGKELSWHPRRFISNVPQRNTLMSSTIEMKLRTEKETFEEDLWNVLRIEDAEGFLQGI